MQACKFQIDALPDILASYPHLTEEDLQAALKFAAETVSSADFIPLAK